MNLSTPLNPWQWMRLLGICVMVSVAMNSVVVSSRANAHVSSEVNAQEVVGDDHTLEVRIAARKMLPSGSRAEAPDRQFTIVSAGGSHSCGLLTDNTIACWGTSLHGEAAAPDGRFTAVSAGSSHSCGLRTDGSIICWGNNYYGEAEAPDGQFTAISAGSGHSCGLRTDKTITCWGENYSGKAKAPDGQFTAISAGGMHSCGLRTNKTITCWGYDHYGHVQAPGGQFAAVSAGDNHSCGLHTDKTITCWHYNYSDKVKAPNEKFTAVSAGGTNSCGLRTDKTITCWGNNYSDKVKAPNEKFTAVSAGGTNSCGLRTDKTITCWGNKGDDIEFVLQLLQPDGTWGNPLLTVPTRFSYSEVPAGRWHSYKVIDHIGGRTTVEVKFRKLASGEIEFALQLIHPDDTQDELFLPRARYLPSDTSIGRWLFSSPLIFRFSPATGKIDIHVFYCVPDNQGHTETYLRHDVARLNEVISTFYSKQSSGLVSLEFIYGGIVSPNIGWESLTIGDLRETESETNPCIAEIQALGEYSNLLVLVGLPPGGRGLGTLGYAVPRSYAVVPTPELYYKYYTDLYPHLKEDSYFGRFLSNCPGSDELGSSRSTVTQPGCHRYWNFFLVAHEIGHSVFDFNHPTPQDCSVMGGTCNNYLGLDNLRIGVTAYIGCLDRIRIGWPADNRCSIEKTGAPKSQFNSVHAGSYNSCGVRNDGTIECWPDQNKLKGKFSTIDGGCGLQTDGSGVAPVSWTPDYGGLVPGEGGPYGSCVEVSA